MCARGTVCRARRDDDQPLLMESATSATQVHCQPAGTSGESARLCCCAGDRWEGCACTAWPSHSPRGSVIARRATETEMVELAPRMTSHSFFFTCLSHARKQQHPGCRRQWCKKAHAAQRVSTCLDAPSAAGRRRRYTSRPALPPPLCSPRLTPLPNPAHQLTFHPVTPR